MLSAATTTTTTTTTAPKNNRRRRRRLENIETSARLLLVLRVFGDANVEFLKSRFEKKKHALFGHFVFQDVRKKPNENTQDDNNARRTTRARTQTLL